MTLGEFKAWLDGFSAAINGAPTAEQWATIREKLGEVQAFPLPAVTAPSPYVPSVYPNPFTPSTLPAMPPPSWATTCGAANEAATATQVWS